MAEGRQRRHSLFDNDDIAPFIGEHEIFGNIDSKVNDDSSAVRSTSTPNPKTKQRTSERYKVIFKDDDPLARLSQSSGGCEYVPKVKKENLTIRLEDEARIVAAMKNAAKKQTSGTIYSVVVDISKTGTLGIGVKDLADNILAVSLLKRENNKPGAGEEAGIRLGDIVFGINFIPTREGSKTLISVIKKETEKGKKLLHVQAWRCHQLCSDAIPGYLFPRADEVIVQAYALFRTKVFSDWERWNFIEIMLGYMIEDLKMRSNEGGPPGEKDVSPRKVRAKQMQVLDLERNILQAKGLRTALCVRIVHTKTQNDTVVYVLRVEDVESGLQWVVHRRYRDFYALNEELLDMNSFTKEVEFPKKRLQLRNTAKLVENRIVALEQYVRRMLHVLTLYATMDSSASRSLRHLQNFLGVDKYVDCVHPPPVDDQRYIELMAYRFLNDFSSPACQQCVRFIATVDLDSVLEPGPEGFRAVLSYVKDALAEVEQFVQQQHQQQMIQTLRDRRPDLTVDQLHSFVRKCIRRQVEAALYLPMRRTVFRIVYSFLSQKSQRMQRAMTLLQQAHPSFLMVDPYVLQAKALPVTVKTFRRVIQAYLPADQGQLLIDAANTVTELHRECHLQRKKVQAIKNSLTASGILPAGPSASAAEAPPATSYSAEANYHKTLSMLSSEQQQEDLEDPSLSNSSMKAKKTLMDAIGRKKSSDADENRASIGGAKRNSFTSFLFRGSSSAADNRNSSSPAQQGARGPSPMPFKEVTDSDCSEVDSDEDAGAGNSAPLTPSSIKPILPVLTRQESGASTISLSSAVEGATTRSSFTMSGSAADPYKNLPYNEKSRRELEILESLLDSNKKSLYTDSPMPEDASTEKPAPQPEVDGQSNDQEKSHGDSLINGDTVADVLSAAARKLQLSKDDNERLSNELNKLALSKESEEADGSHSAECSTPLPEKEAASGSRSVECSTPVREKAAADDIGAAAKPSGLVMNPKGLFDDIFDPEAEARIRPDDGTFIVNNTTDVSYTQPEIISADDFLPLFTYVLVQAGLPQLLLVKELMVALVDDEDAYGECGYYLATLEAATQHILDQAEQYEKVAKVDNLYDDGEDIFEYLEPSNHN